MRKGQSNAFLSDDKKSNLPTGSRLTDADLDRVMTPENNFSVSRECTSGI